MLNISSSILPIILILVGLTSFNVAQDDYGSYFFMEEGEYSAGKKKLKLVFGPYVYFRF